MSLTETVGYGEAVVEALRDADCEYPIVTDPVAVNSTV